MLANKKLDLNSYFKNMIKDLGWVKNFYISNVEGEVKVVFYTRYPISPEDDEFDTLLLRCCKMEEDISCPVNWDLSYPPTFPLLSIFRRWKHAGRT